MEFTVITAIIGGVVGCTVAALWAGLAMVFGLPMPEQQQVVGLMLIGGCGLPIVGWLLALLNP